MSDETKPLVGAAKAAHDAKLEREAEAEAVAAAALPDIPPDPGAEPEPDAAPVRKRGRPKGSTNKRKKSIANYSAAEMEESLTTFFVQLGVMVSFANEQDGIVIGQGAPGLGQAWAALGEENPAVGRALQKCIAGGAWAGAVTATAAVVIPILGNHGLLPTNLLGAPEPGAPPGEDDEGSESFGPTPDTAPGVASPSWNPAAGV